MLGFAAPAAAQTPTPQPGGTPTPTPAPQGGSGALTTPQTPTVAPEPVVEEDTGPPWWLILGASLLVVGGLAVLVFELRRRQRASGRPTPGKRPRTQTMAKPRAVSGGGTTRGAKAPPPPPRKRVKAKPAKKRKR